jgi:tetratricopeptide (TPR) repeat protein
LEKIREAIKSGKDAYFFKTISQSGGAEHKSIRLFKKDNARWKGAIHNHLTIGVGEETDITIRYGYSEAHKKDPDRALRILSKVVKENPKCARERFYLAREYWYRQDYKLAIYYYDYYLENAFYGAEMADAWLMKARCFLALKNIEEAKICALRAITINANFKEAILFVASLLGPKNKKRFEEFAKIATNEDVLFIRN